MGTSYVTGKAAGATFLMCPPKLYDVNYVINPWMEGNIHQSSREQAASQWEQLRRSLTWDQGAEMTQHAKLTIDSGLQVYFCDPQSPWQRGTNENTNGLLRQYFPRGTNLARHTAEELQAVAATLNSRPRKTLSWRTPAEALDEHLRSLPLQTVASTS